MKKNTAIVIILFLMLGCIFPSTDYALSYQKPNVKAPVNMVRSVEKSQVLVGKEFKVRYKFQPQPIPAGQISPDVYLKDKEIVLVMDTSGSMNRNLYGGNYGQSRMEIAKKAAKHFVDKLKHDPSVKISLIEYDNFASVKQSLVKLTDKYNKLNRQIDNLNAGGGTNIGDGLRKAYYTLLNSGSDNARKYIVFLTDGEPTAFSFNDIEYRKKWIWDIWTPSIGELVGDNYSIMVSAILNPIYKMDNDSSINYFVNWGTNDYNNYSLEYAKKVSNMIGNSDTPIDAFFIAFSRDSNSNKLKEIANECNGYYKKAVDDKALDEVYDKLSQQIASDLPIHSIYFEETFPDNIEIVNVPQNMEIRGQKVIGDIGSINYNLNKETNQFEAEPFEFEITLRAKETGRFVLGENDTSFIRYTDIDGTVNTIKYFPKSEISVYENQPPEIKAKISNSFESDKIYKLNIDIDEPAQIEIMDVNGNSLGKYTRNTKGSFDIKLNKEDLVGNYIIVKATDYFQNEVEEKVPLIQINEIDISDNINENNNREGNIKIVTQENSIIREITLNDILLGENRLTDNGEYVQQVELIHGMNSLKIVVVNEYNNIAELYCKIMSDNTSLKIYSKYNNNQTKIMQKTVEDIKFNFKINVPVNDLEFVLDLTKNADSDINLNTISIFDDNVKIIKTDTGKNIEDINVMSTINQNGNLIISIDKDSPIESGEYTILVPIKVNDNELGNSSEFNLNIIKYKINGSEVDLKDSPVEINIKVVKLPGLL
ncbi:vWA domain-containing protein [Caminicella sporogenes]|uniref:vWA domain-containing protein n=1 Tax=Caminicella sporogenes TaxID=166485 RepID=UPI002540A53B|nr:vWA domain-containing protein [Caminicella sporogenes]WIF94521.1 vWA domain-containing protein [Caminicella sporogenes]